MESICVILTQDLFANLTEFDWKNKRLIGEGQFGSCYLLRKKTDKKLYCAKVYKEVPERPDDQKFLLREVLILHSLHHEAIVQFYGFNLYNFESQPFPVIISEFLPNGELESMLKKEINGDAPPEWNNTKKQIIIIGCAAAMRHVQQLGILHRDLKPANILLDSNFYPKICDFGLSRTFSVETQTARAGTPIFMSPEMLEESPYGFPTDVYSFGLLVYQIITTRVPYMDHLRKFRNPSPFHLIDYIRRGGRPQFRAGEINDEFRSFLEKCWDPNPSNRPTFDQIYNAFIDNENFLFANDIDLTEVRNYINYLQSQASKQPSGKKKLRLSQATKYEFYDKPLRRSTRTPEGEMEMYHNIMNNGFQIYTQQEELELFQSLLPTIAADTTAKGIRDFIKVVIFINSLAFTNRVAKDLQKSIFGTLHFRRVASLSSSTIQPELKTRAVLNVSPTVNAIHAQAFKNNQYLILINLPNTITSIGEEAFYQCKSLRWINLNNQMTEISPSSFRGCKSLLYIEFPPQLKTIGHHAFCECTHLTEITIPPTVKTIEEKTFYSCRRLETARVKRGTVIGRHAFSMRTNIVYY